MDVLAIAGIGMEADLARMENISQNSANALTSAYKRQVTTLPAFTVQVALAENARAGQIRSRSAGAAVVSIDPGTGSMRPTGNAQDLAIEGPAFLEVVASAGLAYTKLGSLRVDTQGRLVTGQNLPVMGVGGEIRLANAPFSIAANGDVSQDGRIAGRLKLVTFDDPKRLQAAGASVYVAGEARIQDIVQSGSTLRTGFLEGSNVSTPQEMVHMTETVRHFEALQKLVQGYDGMLENSIRKLGEF